MSRQRGISLIELMIALVLGLLILFSMTVLFANTSRSRMELEKSNRQTENGRYASQLLAGNLRMAGYLAEFDPSPLTITALTALPNPCATATADLIDALPLHVQGVNDATSATAPSCVSDLKSGTDVLVVRRVNSCAAGSSGCAAFANGAPHFQASLCAPATGGTELSYPVTGNADYAANYFTLATSSGSFTKHKSDCTATAEVYRYNVHVYFIANNNESGDGIPTLKRAELGAGSFSIVPLVEGIENLQIDYGIDSDNDGIPNAYTQNPGGYNSCSANDCVQNWRNVMTARINLLARNTELSAGHTDNRVYALGFNDDGSEKTAGAFNDGYKRHVFSETVRLANPAWRRE